MDEGWNGRDGRHAAFGKVQISFTTPDAESPLRQRQTRSTQREFCGNSATPKSGVTYCIYRMPNFQHGMALRIFARAKPEPVIPVSSRHRETVSNQKMAKHIRGTTTTPPPTINNNNNTNTNNQQSTTATTTINNQSTINQLTINNTHLAPYRHKRFAACATGGKVNPPHQLRCRQKDQRAKSAGPTTSAISAKAKMYLHNWPFNQTKRKYGNVRGSKDRIGKSLE